VASSPRHGFDTQGESDRRMARSALFGLRAALASVDAVQPDCGMWEILKVSAVYFAAAISVMCLFSLGFHLNIYFCS
jgi:hypothetical protein